MKSEEEIDKIKFEYRKAFLAERKIDISEARGILEFLDEIAPVDDASCTGDMSLNKVAPYDFEIKEGDIRVCSKTDRITYVAVIDSLKGHAWRVVPFSPYRNPANEREFLPLYRGGGNLSVLQIWNERVYHQRVLEKSWKLAQALDPEDLKNIRFLLRFPRAQQDYPNQIRERTGAIEGDGEELVRDYQREERENFEEMDEEERKIKTSHVLFFPKWISGAVAACIVAAITAVPIYKDFTLRREADRAFFEKSPIQLRGESDFPPEEGGRSQFCSLFGDVYSQTPTICMQDFPEGEYRLLVKEDEGKKEWCARFYSTKKEELLDWRIFGSPLDPELSYTVSIEGKNVLLHQAFVVLSRKYCDELEEDLKQAEKGWGSDIREYVRASIFYRHSCYAEAYAILQKLVAENPEDEQFRNALEQTKATIILMRKD